jgi:hypothetical protein
MLLLLLMQMSKRIYKNPTLLLHHLLLIILEKKFLPWQYQAMDPFMTLADTAIVGPLTHLDCNDICDETNLWSESSRLGHRVRRTRGGKWEWR